MSLPKCSGATKVASIPSFIHFLDATIHFLQPCISVIMLGFWAIAALSLYRTRKVKSWRRITPGVAVGCIGFVGIIGGEFAIAAVIRSAALEEISPFLAGDIKSVTANGSVVSQKDDLVRALRDMHAIPGHHSHPTMNFQISLNTSAGQLQLDLGKDSKNPHEYWVYYREYNSTETNEVARIFTGALDGIGPAPQESGPR